MDARRDRNRPRAVGNHRRTRSPWYPFFLGSLAAVTASFAVLIFAIACNGDADNGATPGPATDTPTPALETPSPVPPTATPTVAPSPTPTYTQDLPCNDILVPINKQNSLSRDCIPPGLVTLPSNMAYGSSQQLRSDAFEAMKALLEAARADGFHLFVVSSYRSYDYQKTLYDGYVRSMGQEQADRVSARPGHSEHQLGTTADVSSASAGYQLEPFIGTPEAAWIEANAWKYGFIVSYPRGAEHITGYTYEPWHIRYVGSDVARRVHESGKTLHEFLLGR
jgi:zinc D-Ala-D-Ala carboxypeptidase